MPYYLGIDGGGTKTRCLLADETTVLAKAMTGGSNIVRLGEIAGKGSAAHRHPPGLRHRQDFSRSDPRRLYRRGRRCQARDRRQRFAASSPS